MRSFPLKSPPIFLISSDTSVRPPSWKQSLGLIFFVILNIASPNLLISSPPVHPIVLQISLISGPMVFKNVATLNTFAINDNVKNIAVLVSKNFSPSFLSLFLLYISLKSPIPFQIIPTRPAINAVRAPLNPASTRTFGSNHTISEAQSPMRIHFHQFIFVPSCL